jgi:hypothetical protein
MKTIQLLALPALLVALAAGPARAHDDHCHIKGPDGKITDAKEHKTKKACEAKGGAWEHHHEHCHKAGTDGKMADHPAAKDKKACETAGGKWSDHAHEGLPPN